MWDVETGVEQGALRGHGRWVRCCDVSPQGDWILSAGFDGVARLWETGQAGETQVLQSRTLRGHDDSILDARFTADGEHVVTASRDRTARLWNSADATLERTYREGHAFLTRRVMMHPTGETMVTSAVDGTVRLWKIDDGRELRVWEGTGRNGLLDISADGLWIATGAIDSGVRLHAIESDDEFHLVGAHEANPTAVAVGHDLKVVVTGDERGRIVVWRRSENDSVVEFVPEVVRHHTDRITDLLWLDHERFISTSRDRTAAIWDLENLADPRIIGVGQEVMSAAAIDAERCLVLTRNGDLELIESATGETLSRFSVRGDLSEEEQERSRTTRLAIDPSRTRAVVVDEGNRSLHWLTIEGDEVTRAERVTRTEGEAVESISSDLVDVAFTLDGTALGVVGGATTRLLSSAANELDDRGLGIERRRYQAQDALSSVALAESEGVSLLVTASWDGSLFVWDEDQGVVRRKLENAHQGRVTTVAMTTDGSEAASGDDQGRLVVWNVSAGQPRYELELPDGIRRVVFLDGSERLSLLVGTESGEVLAIDHAGAIALRWLAHEAAVLGLSPKRVDGALRVLTSGADDIARAWTIPSEAIDGVASDDVDHAPTDFDIEFVGHSAGVNSVDWSPNGRRVVTASDDFTVKLWDARSGKELLTLRGHDREVTTARFDASGTRILSAAHDGLAIIWLAPIEQPSANGSGEAAVEAR
ncbi:MAG: WD40 repeat domain-containing protein [Pirellulaceae bacterium]